MKKETQTKLDDYFSDPFGDEDNEDLLKVMDEIDGVQEKKIKLDSWIKTLKQIGNTFFVYLGLCIFSSKKFEHKSSFIYL